jgi:hypothetical protein
LQAVVDGGGAVPFEAELGPMLTDAGDGVRWSARDLRPPLFKQATELFQDGLTVREVAAVLHISKTEAGRLRMKAVDQGLLVNAGDDRAMMNGHGSISLRS